MRRFVQLCRYQWDRSAAIGLIVIGFVAMTVASLRIRDSVFAFEQIPLLLSGGMVGMCLVAVGIGSWVSADLRDAWRKLDDLEESIRNPDLAKPGPTPAHPLDVRDPVPVGDARQA